MDKCELSCSLLNHYQNEWIHRHSHFWKILSSMYITNLLIICFPFCCSYFNITIENVKIPLKVFPILGIIFAFACCFLLLSESHKLKNLRTNINAHLQVLNKNQQDKSPNNIISKLIKNINNITTILLSTTMLLLSIYVICIL